MAIEDGVEVADFRGDGCDGEEGGALEENDFLGVDFLGEGAEEALDDGEVGDEFVHDAGPSFIEGLIPDGTAECVDAEALGARAD